MEPSHWIGLAALAISVIANVVIITIAFGKLGTKIDVLSTIVEERAKNVMQIIVNLQAENLRLWRAIDELRRGKGYIRDNIRETIDGEYG